MKLTSYFSSLLALAAFVHAAPTPTSQDGSSLTRRADCEGPEPTYGSQITKQEYIDYLKKYYPETNKYMLYSAHSDNQAVNFGNVNPGYYYYNDFFDATRSAHYKEQFPPHPDNKNCWRLDDADAASAAIATVATGDIWVFGAVEWQAKGRDSWFATKEIPDLQTNIRGGGLSKITHMLKDATSTDQVLATEDASEKLTFTEGHDGEKNASGTFGDCSSTQDPPTCDNPSEGIDN